MHIKLQTTSHVTKHLLMLLKSMYIVKTLCLFLHNLQLSELTVNKNIHRALHWHTALTCYEVVLYAQP